MAVALLVAGFAINVAGVAIGSSADLAHLFTSLLDVVLRVFRATGQLLKLWWRRVILRRQILEVHDGSISVTADVVSLAQGYAWAGVHEGDSAAEVLQALTHRTDKLRDLVEGEREDRKSAVGEIASQLRETEHSVTQFAAELHARIDDFAVKPAGQRGFGAFLVIIGSLLMFAGGLLAE